MTTTWCPDKETLEDLYINQLLDDKQIAKRLEVSSFSVWNARKKMGIKGINPQKRRVLLNPQSAITSKQLSIILGGLLGDACLKSKSSSSAYLSIGHSISQKDYILWTYNSLSSICNNSPKPSTDSRGYITYSLFSESRQDLSDLRNKIYPKGKKIISKWWLNQIDPLALAVWYMDDGSLNYINKSKSEFSFATNCFSMEENLLLKDLLSEKYGLHSEIRSSTRPSGKIQHVLFISEQSFKEFEDIIRPYVPNCMKQKLPSLNFKANLVKKIKTNVDKTELERLYFENRLTQSQIARELGVSIGTVRKYMDIFKIEKRNSKAAQLKGKNSKTTRDSTGRYQTGAWTKEEESTAKSIFEELREGEFPYPPIKEKEFYLAMIERLSSLDIPQESDGSYKYSRVGLPLSTNFCPQIFSMGTKGSLTPKDIFSNDELLLDCILRTIRYAKRTSVASVRSGLKTYRKNRCVSAFPPAWASTIIKHLFQEDSNIRVLDFSAGFGGRLIGSYCSNRVKEYTGIDPLSENISSCLNIQNLLVSHSELRDKVFDCNFIKAGAENVLASLPGEYDLVLTSPPYFDKEIYSEELSQCYNSYSDHALWAEEWLKKVLDLSISKLSSDGIICIFATDSGQEKNNVGKDCERILREFCGEVLEVKFKIPSIEYHRKKGKQKFESAWIAKK